MTIHDEDPILRELRAANPVSETEFTELPALGPLRTSAPRRIVPIALVVAVSIALFATLASSPSRGISGRDVLSSAFAADGARTDILRWTLRTTGAPGAPYSDDVTMRLDAQGRVVQVHALRLDGTYRGLESVTVQANGVGNDPTGAVDRTRPRAGEPIETTRGFGAFSAVAEVATAVEKVLAGADDVGEAVPVTVDGRPAYEVVVREPRPPVDGAPRSPSQIPIFLSVDRETRRPLEIRYGEDEEAWRTERVLAFERLVDTPENRRLLDFPEAG